MWARLRGPADQVRFVREALTLENPESEYVRWGDGKTRFLGKGDAFLSGLTWRVVRLLVEGGYPKPIVRWPLVMGRSPLTSDPIELRDYQAACVEKMIRVRRMGVQAPTGAGKTEIGIEAARRIGHRTLWLTHRKELMTQTAARFKERLGITPGVLGAGKDTTDEALVTIAMVPTLARMMNKKTGDPETVKKWLAGFGCVIGDEGHHGSAPTWQDVFEGCSNANYRYVLSATLDTGNIVNNWKIEGATGPTWVVAETVALASRGFLATPHIRVLRVPASNYSSYEEVRETVCPDWREDPMQLRSMGTRLFREAYERGIMNNAARNTAVIETAFRHAAAGEKVLVLCSRVPHAENLAADARRFYPSVRMLDGGSDDVTRQATLNLFRREPGGTILMATPFFREGIDLPQVDVGILAGGGLSDVALTQGLGRVLRPRPDKAEVLWYDFLDGGAPTERSEKDYLAVHSASRLDLYRAQNFKVEIAS